MLWKQVKVKVSKNVFEITDVYFNTRGKSENESFEECFGDHRRVFQYQGEKSESFEDCFGEYFRVFQYQEETSESESF